ATYCEPHTRATMAGEDLRCLIDPHGSLWKYVVNAFQGLHMLLVERPVAIVSTGGGMSIATALIGKLLGVKLIYVESGARVTSPSRTGKLLYRYADLFIVQWEPMLKHFPKAVYGGMLF
ncbi:MAG: PssD/Cps14F family polysaccharide biosynthesis glycosyltransferase, partial [Thiogranum sp.]